MNFNRILASALLTLGLWSHPAQADVAPPPDYVEKCTIERVRAPGEECESCSTYFGEPRKCADTLGSRGFQHRCRTNGASTWGEIWCKSAAQPQPTSTSTAAPRDWAQPPPEQTASHAQPLPEPAAPPPRGCGGCAVGSRPGAIALLLAGAALAWVLHLRRRT